jgi:hypothetical protein
MAVDTSLTPSLDEVANGAEPLLEKAQAYRLDARSSAILLTQTTSR